jgi:hypothetical protein
MTKVDSNGRCCGRKPRFYGHSFYCCSRCFRQFHPVTGEQIENFEWRQTATGAFERRPPERPAVLEEAGR